MFELSNHEKDDDDDLLLFMEPVVEVIVEFNDPVPVPKREKNEKFVLGKDRIINDIIGKFLTYFDSYYVWTKFRMLDKSFCLYIEEYNPKCCENILFSYFSAPSRRSPFVSKLNFRNVSLSSVDISDFPNLTHIFVGVSVLSVRNYENVFKNVKSIHFAQENESILVDYDDYERTKKCLLLNNDEVDVFDHTRYFLDENESIAYRRERRKEFLEQTSFEKPWSYFKTLRRLNLKYIENIIDLRSIFNEYLSEPIQSLEIPSYKRAENTSLGILNPIPFFNTVVLEGLVELTCSDYDFTNCQFDILSKNIRKLHIYRCNMSSYPLPPDRPPDYEEDEEEEEEVRDDGRDAIADLNFYLPKFIKLEDLLIVHDQDRPKLLDESFRYLVRLKSLVIRIPGQVEDLSDRRKNFTGCHLVRSAKTIRNITIECPTLDGMNMFNGMDKLRNLEIKSMNSSFVLNSEDLHQVRCLNLSKCRITDTSLSRMRKLRILTLLECSRFRGPGFQKLRHLRELEITYCSQLTDRFFPYLGQCEVIKLKYCPNVGKDFEEYTEKKLQLYSLPNLRVLILDNLSSFTEKFLFYTPSLEKLSMQFCPGVGMDDERSEEAFLGLKNLVDLTIVKCRMNFEVLKKMQQLRNILLRPWTNHYHFRRLKSELKNCEKFSVEY